ncbi:TPA: hypothetical protein HA281_02020 [Candidatus Woesearchaeota archaeon]|nr:hypothetical protein [Candidatus Woesearchaeota archaeon]HIH05192.1 hypothetical protein [Candidatus Woesearchaeota archaeon]HIH91556.1 hypothetical protein [Candidatus Woesearchaeota archaeon]HII63917.1 hypothetical protein [Candidatus Woesearchaeota archaeon]
MAGFGADAKEALREAEDRLPYKPLSDPEMAKRYKGIKVYDPTRVEGKQFKVEIGYTPLEQAAKAGEVKKKAGSAGPGSSFDATKPDMNIGRLMRK